MADNGDETTDTEKRDGPGRDASATTVDGQPSASMDHSATRHYPLDIPSTPFRRYHHRLLTARDIMVHRIMADFMNPSRVMAKTYDSYSMSPTDRDKQHQADISVISRMLFTNYANTPRGGTYTSGERVLDLVMRHYMETDDAALRMWISHAAIPRLPDDQRPVDPNAWRNIGSSTTRQGAVAALHSQIERQRKQAGKVLTDEGVEHLRSLQRKLAVQDQLRLYDGGASVTTLRQHIDKGNVGRHDTKRGLGLKESRWTMTRQNKDVLLLDWPEKSSSTRLTMNPRWEDRNRNGLSYISGLVQIMPNADLTPKPDRGRNSDGIWSTGRNGPPVKGGEDGAGKPLDARYGRPRRRCTSEPPPGSFAVADLPQPDAKLLDSTKWRIKFPRMTLAQLDRRSRRRSLSRTRIQEMFDWDIDLEELNQDSPWSGYTEDTRPTKLKPAKRRRAGLGASSSAEGKRVEDLPLRCQNCFSIAHHTSKCRSPCGHCGAPSRRDQQKRKSKPDDRRPGYHGEPHIAPQCTVAPRNRCKCVPFPTYHTADRCHIPCRRNCGNSERPGSPRHHNAMLCSSRCCMCGLRGHSGKNCRNRKCRCGSAHLGQDCTWNPTCRVPGCDRFLCGLHCRDCGTSERPFNLWRCGRCLGHDGPLPDSMQYPQSVDRKKHRQGQHGREQDVKWMKLGSPSETQTPPTLVVSSQEGGSSESIFGDPRTQH